MHTIRSSALQRRPPLLDLIDLRSQTLPFALLLTLSIAGSIVAVTLVRVLLWQATAGALLVILPPALLKWRDDARRYGVPAMTLCVLLALQGFHTIEHIAQWTQYHILRWPSFRSNGLLSAANSEWVHFVWNWGFLLVCVYLVHAGMRGWWGWLLLGVAAFHTLEHTYLMWRFQVTLRELGALGITDLQPQGLPGFFGRDGWLATSDMTQNTFLCRLPGFATAPRIDVHFWWNVIEMTFLLPAANDFARRVRAARVVA
ncbi:hypothetical protein [Roseiflexus sp. RS-1]|jgi:hypothetical protein|uniref:hypothetical protein n=1 Tax=Roseiflexus sp. (strain RS-1) TaxID=357808 RepID=UPI0000D7FE00|nr:hypothetical protein [Roseiflexus sp. RS-1]ABQ91260.1 hypothetical protein RoseRS_2892 [Roseiflexus sp. RS-1]